MGEFASKGVAGAGLGTGIAGLALGVLNSGAGLLGNGWGRNGWSNWNNGWNNGCGGGCGGTAFDISVSEALAERDSRIARLEAEKYADSVGLGIYQYFDGQLKEIRQQMCDQAVFNATANGTMSAIAGQLKDTQALLASITRTAVPQSAVCDFNQHSGCNCQTVAV